MRIATSELFDRIRRDDPHGWETVEQLLHHMPSWVQRADAEGDIPDEFWSLVPLDLLNRMNMPIAYGGLPLTATALRRAVVFERVGRICPALPMGMPGPGLSMPPVFALGTEQQKRDYFGRFCGQAKPVWGAFAITEPQGGSDATAMF
jgi:acyl-CoA dehydrogenase